MSRRFLQLVVAGAGMAWTCSAPAVSPSVARQMGNALADAVERVMPSVVVIRTEAVVMHPARDVFFGRTYGIPELLAGQGSGVIIRPDGHVLTSHHVIDRAEEIEVVLNDGTKYPAALVGRDPQTDLAVLKIKAPNGTVFTAIEPGDSDALRVGEFVIAVGSPFSLDSSVTLGIVSQKGRSVGRLPYEDFIQTDASINPGNSGGPLVDVEGRMVGLNAMIQTGGPLARGSIGIGFAVPANLAMRVANQLIEQGRVERPWLGIQLGEMPADEPDRKGGRSSAGVLVGDVYARTPAEQGGLRPGDVIVRVNGVAVNSPKAVQREVLKARVGDPVKLDIRRGDHSLEFELVTGLMPDFSRAEE